MPSNADMSAPADRKSGRRHTVALVTSLLFSAIVIIFLIARVDWTGVLEHMKKVSWWYLPLLVAGFPLLVWIRAVRWRLLLPGRDNLTIRGLSDASFVGFFASTVLPLRAGELIRPWVASRWQPVSFSSGLVSIVIERLADAACMLSLFALCLTQVGEMPAPVLAGAKALGALTVALMLGVCAGYLFPDRMERALQSTAARAAGRFGEHFSGKISGMIRDGFAGLRVITSFGQLIQVIVLTYVIWIGAALWYQCLLWAFGQYPSFWIGMLLNVIVALAVAAPSAPGFLGTFQVGCLIALSTMSGYTEEFAMAYSVVGHLIQMGTTVAFGIAVLQIRGLTFRQMRTIEGRGGTS